MQATPSRTTLPTAELLLNRLEEVFEIGERMLAALDIEDVDTFCDLVSERGAMLQEITEHAGSITRSDPWRAFGSRLRDQSEKLASALAREERRLQTSLGSINRFKGARRSYATVEPRGRILHDNVQG